MPHVFDRVELRTIGWQRHQGDVVGDPQSSSGLVPTCTVEHDHSMRARRDMEADLVEMQAHCLGIDAARHQSGTDPAFCADRAEQPDRPMALVAQPRWSGAAPGPYVGKRSFLPDPCFILKPHLDRLVFGAGRQQRVQVRRETFLKSSCARGACLGWSGRGVSRDRPSACNSLATVRSAIVTLKRSSITC